MTQEEKDAKDWAILNALVEYMGEHGYCQQALEQFCTENGCKPEDFTVNVCRSEDIIG